MRPQVKLATCCYCGARSMLQPTARDGHELACGSCGAPLHEMKWLKSPEPITSGPAAPTPRKPAKSAPKKPKKRKQKRRKPMWQRALAEVWDEIEDIFD